MEFIQQEINKHKTKLMNLINNLINTQLINEEIFINNEIKKESECLISLLNVKQNTLMNQNNNINFNPLIPQPNPFIINAPAINIDQVQPQFLSNNQVMNNDKIISLVFIKDQNNKITIIHCNPQEIISILIKRYREKSNDYDENRFISNGKDLDISSTIYESKFFNGQQIIVCTQGVLKGSNRFKKI